MRDLTTAYVCLIQTLKKFYGDRLWTRAGVTYPVMVFPPPPPEQPTDVDGVLAAPYPREFVDPATFVVYDHEHLHNRRLSRPMTNGVSYLLKRLQPDPLLLEAGLGYYFDMMATCDALDWELRDFAAGKRSDLPLREQFHADVSPNDVPYDGRGRSAVIGVAVLTVFNRGGEYVAIVARRSSTVATGAGLYHVVPAFVFQPSGPASFYSTEWSIRHQILREFGEELFAMPEYPQWDDPPSADYYYDHPPVARLRRMLADGRAGLYLTGVAVNLLSTRPEVCALLIIHDKDWFARSEAQLQAALFTERQETHYIPIDTLEGLPDDLPIRMTPQGAAALWLGLDKARTVLESQH